MEFISAYILLTENNQEVTKSSLVNLLNSISAQVSEESLNLFLSKIEGKTYSEIVASGSELMKSQFSSAPSSVGAANTQAAAKAEEEASEPEEESSGVVDFF